MRETTQSLWERGALATLFKKCLLPFAFLAFFFPSANAQQLVKTCNVTDINDQQGITRVLWLAEELGGINRRYAWTGGAGTFEVFDNGTARLTGNVHNVDNPSYGFDVDIWFADRMGWPLWSSLGRSYKDGVGAAGTDYLDWDYYIVDPNQTSTLTGTGLFSGTLTITHNPTDYTYGLQIGEGASDQSTGYGSSFWFLYQGSINGTYYCLHGDFNMLGGCEYDRPDPVCPDDIVAGYYLTPCTPGGAVGGVFYTGFNATLGAGACSSTNASNLYRNQGSNSCAYTRPGGDGGAFCTGSWEDDQFNADDSEAVRFDISYGAGESGELTELCFWEYAPRGNFVQTNGYTAPNDYPQKFGVRVVKDGVEIYRSATNTTATDWTQRCFSFVSNPAFSFTGPTTFKFELFAYDNVENGHPMEIWELDDIEVKGNCGGCAPYVNDDADEVCFESSTITNVLANDVANGAALDASTVNVTSGPSNGSATVNGDGTITYIHAGGTAGTDSYTYEVTDLNGQTSSATVTITIYSTIDVVGTSVNDATCSTTNDGSIDVSVNGGTAPYIYSWSTGATSQDLSGLGAGTYILTVTDVNGCQSQGIFSILAPNCPPNTGDDSDEVCFESSVITNVLANDSDVDGTLNISSVTIVSAPSNGIATVNADGTITYVHGGGASGTDTYTYSVADDNGDVSTATVTITVYSAVAVNTVSVVDASCSIATDGSIDVSVSGGTAPYTYSWSNGATSQDLTGLGVGTYTVTVTDSKGCQTATMFTISGPSCAPTVNDDTDEVCYESSVTTDVLANDSDVDGTIDPTTVVIVTGPSNGSATVNADGTITYNHAGLVAGTDSYVYQVADDAGVTSTATVTITVYSAVAVNAVSVIDASCSIATDGSIDISVSGGTAPYTYSWSNGATTQDLSGLGVGTYTVTVTDSKGCQTATMFTIAGPSCAPTVNDDSDEVCYESSVTTDVLANDSDVDGTIDSTTVAIVSGPSYGSVTVNADGSITYTHAGLVSGTDTYVYEVADDAGVTSSATVTITISTAVNVAAVSVIDASCSTATDGSIDIDVTGGTSPYSYSWSNGATTQDLSGLGVGTYIVTVTDAKGCQAATIFTISGPSCIPVALDDTDEVCNESSTTTNVLANDYDIDGTLLPGSVTIVSGPSKGVATVNADGSITYIHGGTIGGTDSYTYSVSDDAGNVVTATVTITIFDAILVSGTATPASCGAADGAIDITVAGGTAPYTYNWSNGETTEDIMDLSNGMYIVTVTDSKGCIGAGMFTINELDLVIANVTPFDASGCDVRDGGIIIDLDDASAGTGPYYIKINGFYTAGPFASEPIVVMGAPAGARATTVEVLDANGCVDVFTGPVVVGGAQRPRYENLTVIDAECGDLGGTIVVDIRDDRPGTPPYYFELAPGGITFGPYYSSPVTIDNVPFGSYNNLAMIDAAGCRDNWKFHIDIVEPDCVESCDAPENRGQYVNGGKTVDLFWARQALASGYEINIRPAGTTAWYPVNATDTLRRIGHLTHNSTYDWRVRTVCGGTELSEWSGIMTFTTTGPKIAAPQIGVEVYPNPAVNFFNVEVEAYEEGQVQIQVYNQVGQLMTEKVETAALGLNRFQVASNDFGAGIYEVVIRQNGESTTTSIVIAH